MKIIKTNKYNKAKNQKKAEMAERAIGEGAQTTDAIILRQSIIAEEDATNLYEQFANSTKNERLKKLLLDVAKEEKIHISEFQTLLKEIDKEHTETMEEGEKEVKDLLG